jgi:hypothetical protein
MVGWSEVRSRIHVVGWSKFRNRTVVKKEVRSGKVGWNECLALFCFDYLENIGFIYPAMSMIVIGHSLLY